MDSNADVKDHCMEALTKAGAPTELCAFYADIQQCEYDMTHTSYRMQRDLKDEIQKKPMDASLLFIIIQNMTRKFNYWKTRIDSLSQLGTSVPPLRCSPERLVNSQPIKALCTLETKEMNLSEGEDLIVTDATHPNRLRVRNSKGQEGFVPALCCIVPTPDNCASTAVERLQVHLLTSWTECTRKVKALLFDNLKILCNALADSWNEQVSIKERERVNRRFRRLFNITSNSSNGLDLTRLHSALFSLEKELITIKANELSPMIETVMNLDKAVLCYQNFHRQWKHFRNDLREGEKPIRLVEQLSQLRQIAHGENFKYYEIKLTLEDSEITEEITYINDPNCSTTRERNRSSTDSMHSGSGGKHEAVTTEQLTSSTQEEKKRFVIRSVVDPSKGREISMQEAIKAGVIDPSNGLYVNTVTGDTMPIQSAMNEGFIHVDYVSTTKSAETRKAVGLITIRTRVDHQEYTLTGAVDAVTAERVDAAEARLRGLIQGEGETEGGFYVNGDSGERIPLDDAIDQGWVFADYDDSSAGEYEVKTYAVSEVTDQRLKSDISFNDAVQKGLIDRDTGNYVNNVTKEQVFVVDAIRLGYLKARVIDDPSGLNISTANTVVVERINRVKKNVLKGLRVLSAFKQAAEKGNKA